jgi:hypothetical protein
MVDGTLINGDLNLFVRATNDLGPYETVDSALANGDLNLYTRVIYDLDHYKMDEVDHHTDSDFYHDYPFFLTTIKKNFIIIFYLIITKTILFKT